MEKLSTSDKKIIIFYIIIIAFALICLVLGLHFVSLSKLLIVPKILAMLGVFITYLFIFGWMLNYIRKKVQGY